MLAGSDDERVCEPAHDGRALWNLLALHRSDTIAMVESAVGGTDVEDVVHDAMIRLSSRTNVEATRVRGLLAHSAWRRAIDVHRTRAREKASCASLAVLAMARTGAEGPEALVVAAETVAAMHALVRRLPRREREVVLLRLEGYSVLESAEVLGITSKTVEGALSCARRRLRLMLQAQGTATSFAVARPRRFASGRSMRGDGDGRAPWTPADDGKPSPESQWTGCR